MDNQNNAPNRLINEKSPYLLQHAYNPVDWYPWGSEAFEKAKSEDKPVFLSIGYSTCHWCHVMEGESFEDESVARLLNRDFVCVKVDREERPDVDAVYMTACQALTGSGGWPLTILMTPAQKPFFAATYLPKNSRGGLAGLMELLPAVAKMWREDKKKLLRSGNEITAALEKMAKPETQKTALSSAKPLIARAFAQLSQSFDKEYGGFGGAPKFPTPHHLLFCMEYAKRENAYGALDMAAETLVHMYRGGIFDHIGGGYSRYSTDGIWLVPHFEKMLYDNALLTMANLEAFRLTGRELFSYAAEKTMAYILRELTDAGGGFYCGQDADSDGVEGKYYTFSPGEIADVLGAPKGAEFCSRYDVTPDGNFEGKSIPNLIKSRNDEIPEPEMQDTFLALYGYRLKRARLHKDDKVLTSWNGLMIAAFARAALVLGRPDYLAAAKRAEAFLSEHATRQGRPLVRWRDGEAAGDGKLEDYAFFIWGLLEIYRASFETEYLKKAVQLADVMTARFFDDENGGFYLYAADSEQLILRPKEVFDNALPSGNSVAAFVLEKLSVLTGEERFRSVFEKQAAFLAQAAKKYPAGLSFGLLSLFSLEYPSRRLICLAPSARDLAGLKKLARDFADVCFLIKTDNNEKAADEAAPDLASYPLPQDGARFYLCVKNACLAPVSRLEDLKLDA